MHRPVNELMDPPHKKRASLTAAAKRRTLKSPSARSGPAQQRVQVLRLLHLGREQRVRRYKKARLSRLSQFLTDTRHCPPRGHEQRARQTPQDFRHGTGMQGCRLSHTHTYIYIFTHTHIYIYTCVCICERSLYFEKKSTSRPHAMIMQITFCLSSTSPVQLRHTCFCITDTVRYGSFLLQRRAYYWAVTNSFPCRTFTEP